MTTDFPIHEILRSRTASSNSTSFVFSTFPTSVLVLVLALLPLLHWLLPFDFVFFTESPRKYLNTHCSCTETITHNVRGYREYLRPKLKSITMLTTLVLLVKWKKLSSLIIWVQCSWRSELLPYVNK